MRPKISKKQLISIFNLLQGLKDYEKKGYGVVKNLTTMSNVNFPDNVYIRYEKHFSSGGERGYEYRIAQVDKDGFVTFIDEVLKDLPSRYSFLGECVVFDLEDPNTFEKVD